MDRFGILRKKMEKASKSGGKLTQGIKMGLILEEFSEN